MRIVNRAEFLKLPIGTLYSEYQPCVSFGLMIKGGTIVDANEIHVDYYFIDLIGQIDYLNLMESNSVEDIEVEIGVFQRDGMYNEDQLYVIYSQQEKIKISNLIAPF